MFRRRIDGEKQILRRNLVRNAGGPLCWNYQAARRHPFKWDPATNPGRWGR
jgi:hypothetical protein